VKQKSKEAQEQKGIKRKSKKTLVDVV